MCVCVFVFVKRDYRGHALSLAYGVLMTAESAEGRKSKDVRKAATTVTQNYFYHAKIAAALI